MTTRPDTARSIVLVLLLGLLATGCGAPGGSSDGAEPPERSGLLMPSDIGLEVRIWHIEAVGGPLLGTLMPYALAAEAGSDPKLEHWRKAGFRMVMVPQTLIESVEPGLPHVDAIGRLSLGQPVRWTGLGGSAVPDGHSLRVPGGTIRFSQSRLELLVRAWIEPAALEQSLFRVELAVGWSGAPRAGTEGRVVLADLFYSVSVPRGFALVVLPAPPGEDWAFTPDPDQDLPYDEIGPVPADYADEPGFGVAILPAPVPEDMAAEPGPTPPEVKSVGEFMFIAPAVLGDRPVPARRGVFVLIPRWP